MKVVVECFHDRLNKRNMPNLKLFVTNLTRNQKLFAYSKSNFCIAHFVAAGYDAMNNLGSYSEFKLEFFYFLTIKRSLSSNCRRAVGLNYRNVWYEDSISHCLSKAKFSQTKEYYHTVD